MTPTPKEARVVAPIATEAEINHLLGEWLTTSLTDEQKALLEEDHAAGPFESQSWPEDKKAVLIEARGIVFANSTARQRQYTRDLNAMALVRAKMSYNQTMVFTERLMFLVSAQDENETDDENIFAAIDADAGAQAKAACQAIQGANS